MKDILYPYPILLPTDYSYYQVLTIFYFILLISYPAFRLIEISKPKK